MQYTLQGISQFDNKASGNAAPSIPVYVYSLNGELATLYSGANTNSSKLQNPLYTDDIGRASFYAKNGNYNIVVGNQPPFSQTLFDINDYVPDSSGGLPRTGGTILGDLDVTGNLTASEAQIQGLLTVGDALFTGVAVTSDERLKSDIKPINNALALVSQIPGFTYVINGNKSAGVLAQDVQKVLPQAVKTGGEYLAVDYNALTAALFSAVNQLAAQVEKLKRD